MNNSILSNKVAMSKNMTEESTEFAAYLRNYHRKNHNTIEDALKKFTVTFFYGVGSDPKERNTFSDKIRSELDFIIAWYAFDYLMDEYGYLVINEEIWQIISDGLSGIELDFNICTIEESVDNSVDYIIDIGGCDLW